MEISDIREKFFPIFRPENIDNITAEDFKSFFSTDVKEFFATRDSNLEHMYSGIVTKGTNFDDVKKVLKVLVRDSSDIGDTLREIFEGDSLGLETKMESWFKADLFSPILHIINYKKYAIFNTRVAEILKIKYGEQFDAKDWRDYAGANRVLHQIARERNCTLYELDQYLGNKNDEHDDEPFRILEHAIKDAPAQANYQYVMIRYLLGKKSASVRQIARELKRWNSDKPDDFDFKATPVFDTKLIRDVTEEYDGKYTLTFHKFLNFYERHSLISLCERKISDRIDQGKGGTIPYSNLVFSALTDKQEIEQVHNRIVSKLKNAATKSQEFNALEFKGEGHWLDKHGIFFYNAINGLKNRYWDIFGTEQPVWDNKWLQNQKPPIDIEINPPLEGDNWQTSAQFLKDNNGRIYYTHNGYLNDKSRKDYAFRDMYAGLSLKTSNYSDGKEHTTQFLISDVESEDFVENVADFVKEAHDFKEFVNSNEYQNVFKEYFIIRPGRGGDSWEAQRDGGVTALGFYNVDLSKCTQSDGKTLLEDKVKKQSKETNNNAWGQNYPQLELLFNANKTVNDCTFVAIGKTKEILGVGKATGQYKFESDREHHKHTIPTNWHITEKQDMPKKALESISWLKTFPQSIKKLSKSEYDLIMASKYQPLTDYLLKQDEKIVTLSLQEISSILGFELPPSATDSNGPTWWANEKTHLQARAWKDAGYKTKNVSESLRNNEMSFERDEFLEVISDDELQDSDYCDEWEEKGYFDLLKKKSQVIFYGPPGTGKTWTAKKVAKCFTNTKVDDSPPEKFIERIIEELRERAEDAGYIFEKYGTQEKQKMYILRKDRVNFQDEIRVDFHEANTDYFQINAGTKFFAENRDSSKNFLILTKESIESFVCLPYDEEQKYSKFVSEGDGTGGWDSTGKGKHSVHNLKINEIEAHFEPKDDSSEIKNISEYLNTWDSLKNKMRLDHSFQDKFDSTNRGKDIYNVTFHPSYSYEDFVEGFRPNENGQSQYILDDGIFKIACKHAKLHSDRKIVLIIDEINRGNIPKIFGELISLIEHDKRNSGNSLKLAYSKQDFFVPENLYIIGTMNTADKSLVQMDEALRRRFAFEELMPNADLLDDRKAVMYKEIMQKLNQKIVSTPERMKQYRDKQIGHSYFWDIENDADLQFVIKYQIIPLLQDYFYDDYEEIKTILGDKIIGSDNRPTDLLDSGKETELKKVLLDFLNNKEESEQEE